MNPHEINVFYDHKYDSIVLLRKCFDDPHSIEWEVEFEDLWFVAMISPVPNRRLEWIGEFE
jgi:hypothetical protein